LNSNQNIYNMATFCAKRQPELTILINEYNTIVVFQQFLCVMFELLTSYKIWTMTRLLFSVSFFYQWHSMKTFCLKCLPWPKIIISHHRNKEWIESTMAMSGLMWSQPISRIILAWVFRKVHCLGHLHCMHDNYDCFFCSDVRNKIIYNGKLAHILVKG
jgi:hypothetical protein